MNPTVALALLFGQLSLLAFGGANSILPDLQRQVVGQGWMSGHEFAALFALAQAAPGPNMMVVSLIGWRVAGLSGALVSTIAIAGPTSVLTYLTAGAWFRLRDRPWRKAIQAGLLPVTVGLVMASAALITASTILGWQTGIIAAAVAGLVYFTKFHPLPILAGAAALGALGFAG
jgi:chromate transporter